MFKKICWVNVQSNWQYDSQQDFFYFLSLVLLLEMVWSWWGDWSVKISECNSIIVETVFFQSLDFEMTTSKQHGKIKFCVFFMMEIPFEILQMLIESMEMRWWKITSVQMKKKLLQRVVSHLISSTSSLVLKLLKNLFIINTLPTTRIISILWIFWTNIVKLDINWNKI